MAVIYRHLKPCGEVFYIGIGEKVDRAYDTNKRSKFWKDLVRRHGHEVQVLKSDLTWEEACELETVLIMYYGRRDLKTGTLVNMTDGGQGSKGAKPQIYSQERLLKMRDYRIKASEKNIKYICTKTLKTFGSITLCSEYVNIKVCTLLAYLNPNIPSSRNITTIMLYEDYLKYGVIEPEIKRNKPRECINTLTKEIFNSISSAAKSENMTFARLYGMLSDSRVFNRTNIVFLDDYDGEVHLPQEQTEKTGVKIRNIKTEEIFPSKASLARHLGVSEATVTNWIRKEKIEYEYV